MIDLKKIYYTRVIMLALLTLLSACTQTSWKKPEIKLADIKMGQSSLVEQQVDLSLHVTNPNRIVLKAQGLYFELNVAGVQMATGTSNQPIVIHAMSDGLIPLRVQTSLIKWLALMQQQGASPMHYQISGYIDGLGGLGRIPFKSQGDWKLPR